MLRLRNSFTPMEYAEIMPLQKLHNLPFTLHRFEYFFKSFQLNPLQPVKVVVEISVCFELEL